MMLGIKLPHDRLRQKIHKAIFKRKKHHRRRRAAPLIAPAIIPPADLPAAVPADPGMTTYTPTPAAPMTYAAPTGMAIPGDPFYATASYPPPSYPPQFFDQGGGYPEDPFYEPPAEDPFEQTHLLPEPSLGPELDDDTDELETGEGALEGIFDSSYWADKWESTVAWFQAQIAGFFALKNDLLKHREIVDKAIATAQAHPDRVPAATLANLQALKGQLEQAITTQKNLEPKVTEQLKKIGAVSEQKAAGMGFAFLIPIAIGAAAVATIVAVGGAVIIHMRNSADLNRQIDLVAAGVLSAGQVEQIKQSGPAGDLFGLGNLKTVGYLVLGGIALWYGLPLLTGKRRA